VGNCVKSDLPCQPGAGLGIALAQKAITQMGGSIRYESIVNKGTLVIIEVPLQIHPQRVDDDIPQNGLTVPHCALIGFDDATQFGIHVVGDFLARKLQRRNAVVCPLQNANIVIIEERALDEAVVNSVRALGRVREIDTIVLGSATSKRRWRSNPPFLDRARSIPVRWLFRPLNPALMMQILHKRQTSVSSGSLQRRSSVWTNQSSRASFAGSLSYESPALPESPAVEDDGPNHVVTSPVAMEVPPGPERIPVVTADHLKNDLQALKQCLAASDLKGQCVFSWGDHALITIIFDCITVLIVEDNAVGH
jgi:hypothetical protein